MAAAYLGGHLVFRESVGVAHMASPNSPREFAQVM
jgi:trimethylamine:corrinoid methyltransferase-like protein